MGRQTSLPAAVVLLVNNCTDATEDIANATALPFPLDVQSVCLQAHDANAGTARRLAMDRAALLAGPEGVIMTTDADAIVPPDWVALNMAALTAGADAVCGRALIDPEEAAAIPAHLHNDDALECEYAGLLDAITDALCPDRRSLTSTYRSLRREHRIDRRRLPASRRRAPRGHWRSGEEVRRGPQSFEASPSRQSFG
jgi:hypothetical protein